MATIYAVDTEIAKATGSNINSAGTESDFDTPLTDMTNLVITTDLFDLDPYLFELGDTATLQWKDGGVTHTMFNAEVTRSDLKWGTDNQGAVVFQGTDTNGNDTQILWTPDLNVQQWYADTQASGKHPMFYTTDQHPSTYGYAMVCFAGETRIETDRGLVRIDALKVGDKVATFDHGYQEIRWIGHSRTRAEGKAAPIRLEAGAMGQHQSLRLSPNHRVVMRDRKMKQVFGQSQVFVAAKALAGRPGITVEEGGFVDYYNVLFDKHEVIFAEGLACESLYLGEMAREALEEDVVDPRTQYPDLATVRGIHHKKTARPVMDVGHARAYFRALDVCEPA